MHAAVLHETGKPLQIERVHLADLGPRDVLIKLGASGLCHTDLEVMRGALPLPLPIVLGHEGAGRVEARSTVVVVGCGAVGLNVLQGARLAGARRIIAVDLSERHLAMAAGFGATHTLHATREDVPAAVRALTGGRGADYAFEAAGTEASLQQTLEAARPGARVVVLGKTAVNDRVSLRFGSLMGEKRIVRSSYGGARPRVDFPRIAQAYLDGQLRL